MKKNVLISIVAVVLFVSFLFCACEKTDDAYTCTLMENGETVVYSLRFDSSETISLTRTVGESTIVYTGSFELVDKDIYLVKITSSSDGKIPENMTSITVTIADDAFSFRSNVNSSTTPTRQTDPYMPSEPSETKNEQNVPSEPTEPAVEPAPTTDEPDPVQPTTPETPDEPDQNDPQPSDPEPSVPQMDEPKPSDPPQEPDEPNTECLHANVTTEPDKAPSCEEAGYYGKQTCSDCGATLRERVVRPATGHTFTDGVCACGKINVDGTYLRTFMTDGGSEGTEEEYHYTEKCEQTLVLSGSAYSLSQRTIKTENFGVIGILYDDVLFVHFRGKPDEIPGPDAEEYGFTKVNALLYEKESAGKIERIELSYLDYSKTEFTGTYIVVTTSSEETVAEGTFGCTATTKTITTESGTAYTLDLTKNTFSPAN